jgi:hypothetical protein
MLRCHSWMIAPGRLSDILGRKGKLPGVVRFSMLTRSFRGYVTGFGLVR